jgi:hypothetical protein
MKKLGDCMIQIETSRWRIDYVQRQHALSQRGRDRLRYAAREPARNFDSAP